MNDLRKLFEAAGCRGFLYARSLTDGGEIELSADEPVVLASVFKIAVALEFARQAASGELDPSEQVVLPADTRTPGPTGLSVCQDDAVLSYRDLAYFMMSISDNAATDALVFRVGLDRINQTLQELGLMRTVIPWSGQEALDLAAREFGFGTWRELQRAQAGEFGPAAKERANDLTVVRRSELLDSARSMRSTAREIGELVGMIWSDSAGPSAACEQVRWLLSHQPKTRVAARLPSGCRASVKSGSLWGVARNEAGVIEVPGAGSYVISVFTRAHEPFARGDEIEVAIAEASSLAITSLANR